jgi:DNA helicase-2/ATP-dependent DNA helicase PcrA
MALNSEQQEVVNAHDGAYALIAGPGSGKTHTLIARYQALLAKGVRPDEILGITFTKEASVEMQRRAGKGQFRTFHSYGYSVVSAEKGRAPMEPELRHRLICKLIRKYGLDYKELTNYISRMRHKNISPAEAMEENGEWKYGFPRAYNEYEVERMKGGWIDFDSMIRDAVNLLEDPNVRQRHQWKYVMADECQDTDDLQFRLLQLITEKHGNILCVGDAAQSIYMFRGAEPKNLLEFTKWFPKAKYLYLGTNYRSTHAITTFVRENYPIDTPLRERLQPARLDKGEEIQFRLFNSETDEAESAIVSAQKDPLNSAILARTNRMLGPLENFCIENNIKYTLLGRSGFWKQSEITRAVEKLKPYSHLNTEAAMSIVMPGVENHYRVEDATEEDNDALENLRTLREISRKFPACQDFVGYANRAAHAKRSKGITISTVHQAKGTEYTNVFLIGARDGMIPHSKGDWLEERRIAFVAISRAKDRLRISWAGTPSPFFRKWLPADILAQLQANAAKVERLQKQLNLLDNTGV